jgi:hypothetical protein
MPFCTNCGAQAGGAFCPQCGQPVGPARPSFPSSAPPPAGGPLPPPAKPGGALKWVLLGCLGVLVVGGVVATMTGLFVASKVKEVVGEGDDVKNPAVAAAKLLTALNPDLELVSSDSAKGTVTIRDKKTNKTVTVNFEDLKKGRIVFEDEEGKQVEVQTQGADGQGGLEITTPEGRARIGGGAAAKLPSWVPVYPGTTPQAAFTMRGAQSDAAAVNLTSPDSVQKVAEFYESSLKQGGFTVSKSTLSAAGGAVVNLAAKNAGRQVNVTITGGDGGTQVNLLYEDR